MSPAREAPPPPPRWPDRSAGWGLTLLTAAGIVAASAWLLDDRLDGFSLKLDDFVYLAESRTPSALAANLWKPHNAHVVPLFRLLTFGLVALAGGLGRFLDVAEYASFGVLVLGMVATGVFVARETRRGALGLAAMAGLGLSSALEPAATWYAASQAIWAALAVILMLLALQAWRIRGSAWRLAPGALAALAAPLFWAGGFVAGPVGLAYLWADGRPRALRASLVPLVAALLAAAGVLGISGRQIAASGALEGSSPRQGFRPFTASAYTAQAVPEWLVLRNAGLDVPTDAPQAAVLCLVLALVWGASRGRPRRPSPLEAAGAVMAVLGCFLVFLGRGYREFDSLRGLGWYQALPQVGAVLFAAGWAEGRATEPGPPRPPSRRALLSFAALASVYLVLQVPLVVDRFLADAAPLSESERKVLPTRELHRLRARFLASDLAARQERFLTRLDGAERIALRLGVGRDALRAVFGPVYGPGMPGRLTDLDAFELLALPPHGPGADVSPARVRQALRDWLAIEPEPRPFWVQPGDAWPPRRETR